jgi:hypothetical protein
MATVFGIFDVGQNLCAREPQALFARFPFELVSRANATRCRSLAFLRRGNLVFYRLAFPSTCHESEFTPPFYFLLFTFYFLLSTFYLRMTSSVPTSNRRNRP